jgi:hypothetical protein
MARTIERTYPKIFDAVRKAETAWTGHQWDIGDALIDELGDPGRPGVNNGSSEQFEEIAKALQAEGFDRYTVQYLRDLRSTAAKFTATDRSVAESWTAHAKAGDPETLKRARRKAKDENKRLTVKYIANFKKIRDRNRQTSTQPPDRDRESDFENFLTAAHDACDRAQAAGNYLAPHLSDLSSRQFEKLRSAARDVRDAWRRLIDQLDHSRHDEAA